MLPLFPFPEKMRPGLLELLRDQEEITVTFDAESRVTRNCTTYNIVGRIPGKHPDRMVLCLHTMIPILTDSRMTIQRSP